MDLLQGVKDMEEEKMMTEGQELPSMENMPVPSVEELLKALDGFSGMSDEDKESLRAQLMAGGMQNMAGNQGFSFQQFFVLISLLLIVACIFVFFGYKLYKSLVEKDRKREEKRKMKQQKKKK